MFKNMSGKIAFLFFPPTIVNRFIFALYHQIVHILTFPYDSLDIYHS